MVQRSLALSLAVLLLVLVAPLAGAAQPLAINITSETYTAQFTIPVYNSTLALAANTTQTINMSLPENWTADDVAYVLVHVKTDAPVKLEAITNGTTVASADVVPLSSGYTITLPYSEQIKLSAQKAANATIKAYLVSVPANFTLTVDQKTVNIYPKQPAWVKISIKQESGPRVFVYFNSIGDTVNGHLGFGVFTAINGTSFEGANNGRWTTGAGWADTAYLRLYWDGAQGAGSTVPIQIILMADPDGPNGPIRPMSVAMVSLNVPAAAAAAADVNAHLSNISAKTLGLGILAVLALFLLLGGGKHGRGRRGTGTPNALLLLVLFAAMAIGLGLVDVNVHPSIDWKMLGIGIVALLLFLMLAKPGAVQKAARRIGL